MTANLWELWEELAVGGPSEANSNNSLFGERIIEDQEPELFTSFYTEWNPADQAPPHSFQPFSLKEFQTPSPIEPMPFSGDQTNVTFSPYFTFTPPYFLYDYLIPLVQGHMAIHAA